MQREGARLLPCPCGGYVDQYVFSPSLLNFSQVLKSSLHIPSTLAWVSCQLVVVGWIPLPEGHDSNNLHSTTVLLSSFVIIFP